MKNEFEIEQTAANGVAHFLAFVLFAIVALGCVAAGYTVANVALEPEATKSLKMER